jgi:hypothetical protein
LAKFDPGNIDHYKVDFLRQKAKSGGWNMGKSSPKEAPNTATRTNHALTIHGIHGSKRRVIGAISDFNVQQSRALTEIQEVNVNAYGQPVDIIPGHMTTRTINVQRYDLYSKVIEELFADDTAPFKEWNMLLDQTRPFVLRTVWLNPSGGTFGAIGGALSGKRVYEFLGCWFTSMGRTISSKGDRIINVNATIQWKERRRIK